MRKILLIILLIVLCILSGYTLLEKLQIVNIEILGIREISDKNDELNSAIAEANEVSTITYKDALKRLDTASQNLKKQKEEYDNYIIDVSQNEGLTTQVETYEIEYLWTKIGNYATDEGVVLKMDVAVNNASLGLYNLNFSVTGKYISIIDFIYDLENDSSLSFKIEEFSLKPNSSEEELVATFVCKDININIDSSNVINSDSITTESTDNVNGTDSSNNTTDSTSSTNNTTNTATNR